MLGKTNSSSGSNDFKVTNGKLVKGTALSGSIDKYTYVEEVDNYLNLSTNSYGFISPWGRESYYVTSLTETVKLVAYTTSNIKQYVIAVKVAEDGTYSRIASTQLTEGYYLQTLVPIDESSAWLISTSSQNKMYARKITVGDDFISSGDIITLSNTITSNCFIDAVKISDNKYILNCVPQSTSSSSSLKCYMWFLDFTSSTISVSVGAEYSAATSLQGWGRRSMAYKDGWLASLVCHTSGINTTWYNWVLYVFQISDNSISLVSYTDVVSISALDPCNVIIDNDGDIVINLPDNTINIYANNGGTITLKGSTIFKDVTTIFSISTYADNSLLMLCADKNHVDGYTQRATIYCLQKTENTLLHIATITVNNSIACVGGTIFYSESQDYSFDLVVLSSSGWYGYLFCCKNVAPGIKVSKSVSKIGGLTIESISNTSPGNIWVLNS